MSQGEVQGFPQFAPLSTPFVKLLLEHQDVTPLHITTAISIQEQLEQTSRHLQGIWAMLEQRVHEKRQRTYSLMTPAVHIDFATGEQYVLPSWLRETLSSLMPVSQKNPKKELITPQALSVWNDKNVLRHRAWGQLEAQSTATVITARQLDETRARFWLPSVVDANEPYWWCYSQAVPINGIPAPIVPCPVPLPQNISPSTLLWTPWSGASWDPRWLQLGYLGAIRWAGASIDGQGRIQWGMSESDLKKWDPEVVSLDMGFLKHTKEMLNGVAHFALLRLASTRLHSSPSLAN